MNIPDDATYYAEREASEKRRAELAADPTARYAHITMAAEYRRLAAEARRSASLESAHIITPEPAAGGVPAHRPSPGRRQQHRGAPARAASAVTADRTSSPEARR